MNQATKTRILDSVENLRKILQNDMQTIGGTPINIQTRLYELNHIEWCMNMEKCDD